jgi:hypothetical protein
MPGLLGAQRGFEGEGIVLGVLFQQRVEAHLEELGNFLCNIEGWDSPAMLIMRNRDTITA